MPDLRSTLEAAVASAEKQSASAPAPAPSPAPAPAPVEAPAPAPAPAPAEAGSGQESSPYGENKGVSDNPSGGESATPPKIEQNSGEKGKEPNAQESQSSDPGAERAPQSWKAGSKAKWASIDPEVRLEIQRREREITKTLSDSAASRRFATEFRETVNPFKERLQGANVHPLQAVKSLLHIDQTMATSTPVERAKMAAAWLQSYQVDFQLLDQALSGAAIEDPNARVTQLLERELAPVRQFIQGQTQREQQMEQREAEQAQSSIEAMANDNVKYPDFDLVREDMADIIEINQRRGVPLTLDQAYTKAVAMNDDAKAAAAQRSKQNQAQQANGQAQRSMNASLSVSGNPAALRTNIPATDLRGTLEAAVAAHSGR